MATNKNITMKQYNGTDYDTLYPATTSAQIIGQIPVNKVDGALSGTVSVANGGTGATNAASARTNLGITPSNIGAAPAYQYSTTDLTAGTSSLTTGTLYFVYE